jgi:hypothetical protein
LAGLVVILTCLFVVAVPARAGQLRMLRLRGGFSVRAPAGYRLHLHGGVYSIAGRAAQLTIVELKTNQTAQQVAAAVFPKLLGGRQLPAVSDPNAFALLIQGKNGRRGELQFRGLRGVVSIVGVSPRGRTKVVSGKLRRTLARIAASARHIHLVTLPESVTQRTEAPIALTTFTAADGTATAQVPAEAGWIVDGSKGMIDGINFSRGEFELGLNAPIITPEADPYHLEPGYEADYQTAAQAVTNAWPALRSSVYPISNVRILSVVPGTTDTFGPGWDSGLFEVSFDQRGATWHGFAAVGTYNFPSAGNWLFYISEIAVPDGTDPAVGAALVKAWASFNPTVAEQQRLAQAAIDQQQVQNDILDANDYRLHVIDKTDYNWDQIIQGNNPVLLPVAGTLTDQYGDTLVEDGDGNLFTLYNAPR